jgi:predicted nucleic acid binding AN1-type Zn finger protein
MTSCDVCGETVSKEFTCSHCGTDLCGEHRLPEAHDCPSLLVSNTKPLASEGPDTSDRRGTPRKRRDRVREKEPSRYEARRDRHGTRKRTESSRFETVDDESGPDVLTCPCCDSSVSEITSCRFCGRSVCEHCKSREGHNCRVAPPSDDTESPDSLVNRLLSLFR